MIRVVIDNQMLGRCRIVVFCIPTFRLVDGVRTVRDLAISLKLDGVSEDAVRETAKLEMRHVIATACYGACSDELARVGEQDVEDFLGLARPLCARPLNERRLTDRNQVIDVEFEEVDGEASSGTAVLVATPVTF